MKEAEIVEMVGESPAFKRVLRQAINVAKSEDAVLIFGESGTGKELMARAIHRMGSRRSRSFVKLDCSRVDPTLLEMDLFGSDRSRLEAANQGTLLLKHIEAVPPLLQPKVSRAIERQEFGRPGGTTTAQIDVRFVTTLSDIGLTFQDFWICKNHPPQSGLAILRIPPLRERKSDIPLLAWHFSKRWAQRMNKSINAIPSPAMESLVNYRWSNNVRELEMVIERAVRSAEGPELQTELPGSAA